MKRVMQEKLPCGQQGLAAGCRLAAIRLVPEQNLTVCLVWLVKTLFLSFDCEKGRYAVFLRAFAEGKGFKNFFEKSLTKKGNRVILVKSKIE